ncbi:PGF-pre-PGF domain-containing protein [Methanosarcina sp. 2.H.T.1A.8]|uniref:PGF-pre-PGF domain-containing protein n=1 Tax=Methanosarcina sp. 2.H.T.1A.8 TaxID=1483598 RepID=UPI000621DC42|nr:PGF-pre-PGF domain-containing protein [Methanosarcina sp. 2.H.T.1A.8]KKG20929.1 hypothetical protein EO96_07660 [Methanosarcina sp. 2.H.T.1A.8]
MWQIKRLLSILFTVALALQVITGYAAATEFYVGDDGPGNYTTIQEALKDAVDGDIILVSPGTYPDETIFVNKSVTIKGAAGAEYPSVGGFSLLRHSRIEGLTITKGVDFSEGGVSCTIRNNRFNGCGVSMGTSYMYGNQTIMNNLFMGSPVGVSTYDSIDNKITGNTFRECDIGITLTYGAGGHIVTGNIIKNCGIGLYIIRDSASVYNNYFLNDVNLLIEDGNPGGSFSVPNMPGLNIIGGPYIGGNFWGSPAGAGFSQIHLDANGDGFAEEPYSLNEQNIDYLPLVTPRTEPVPVPPVADFTANPTSGSAPLPVQFTDRSQNATSRSWKFGDGATSSDTNPTHSYYKAGNYTVNLTVSNLKGTDSKTAVITVLEENVDNDVFPVADFIANPTSGSAPLSVSFTDRSQNATSRSWNFGDGATSNDTNPTHSYSQAGNYTVNLTVSNLKGINSKTAVITVLEENVDNDVLPVANFETNVTSGYAPLSVLFTDRSQDATSRSWDFGDGVTSTELNPTHTYSLVGTYPAKLTVSNANGTTSKTILIAVERKSSGGSSSGGGGGSPESSRNIEAKELSQVFITNGKAVKFDFTKEATCVVYVSFDAKKTAGKITTIAEMLKGKSSLVSELPSGEVYKSFNLWVGNGGFATSNNIENPVVCFKVEKAWIQDKKIDRSTIALNRYSDKKWGQLPVSLLKEDDKYLYFTADVPGFSSFAITGKANTSPEETVTEIQPDDESGNSEKNTEDTGSEVAQEPGQDENSTPGFEMVYGVAGLLAVLLYKRK